MKNKIVVASVIVIAFGIGVWWTMQPSSKVTNEQQNSDVQVRAKYFCPMHPQITSDQPGTCPICGMDLVAITESKRRQNHQQNENTTNIDKPNGRIDFELSLNKQQLIGVKIQKAERKALFKSIRVPGRIAFDPELYTAQSEYIEALRQWNRVKDSPILDVRENTRQMIRSSKIRLQVLGLSDAQISNLTKKGSQSEALLVGGRDNLVYADVFEVDLPYIKEGQSAQITANFLQGKTLPGKITSVDQVIDPETRTAKVRIKLLKADSSIRPESYVNVTIFAPVGEHVAVPLEAIMDTGIDTFVFVKKGEGRFEPRKVQVYLETQSEAALAKGVSPGEEVVVGANFLLDSESRLNAVIEGNSAPSSEHNH